MSLARASSTSALSVSGTRPRSVAAGASARMAARNPAKPASNAHAARGTSEPSPPDAATICGDGVSPAASAAAWALLAGFAAFLAAILALAPAANDLGLVPLTLSADVLEARAKDIGAALGYVEPPRDGARR